MNDPTKARTICELLRVGPYQREGADTRLTMEGAADLIEQLVDSAVYARDVLNTHRGKQAKLRAIERLQAVIAKAREPQA